MRAVAERERQKNGISAVRTLVFSLLAGLMVFRAAAVQPVVAIHDSELTRALETMPATNGTPDAAGSTGFQWWTTNWHYFVMPDSIKEALRSDGTAFTTLSDADIIAGQLLDTNGQPNYPIVISLASEAMSDQEIAPLTNYVAAGGMLFIGSSSFTRTQTGATRGDFALAKEMGLHMVVPGYTNWALNATFSRISSSPLVSHIPAGRLSWQMPSASEEISWPEVDHVPNPPTGLSHLFWMVQPAGASVLAQGDNFPYILTNSFGKGTIVYDAAEELMIGHGGWAPGMYSYGIIRNAIQQAFAAAQLPISRLSAWPYNYDAAVIFRHDMEAVPSFIQSIEVSAQYEYTNGARGDYFFCTGELRENMPPNGPTIAALQAAVSSYGATIGPHNGGFTNINTYYPALTTNSYDYWHWGPDEMFNSSPAGYASGQAFAIASISNSFSDMQGWLGVSTNNGIKLWVAPYFNATREGSYQLEAQLGIQATGEQKAGPYPHWTISTQTPDLRYPVVQVPVSDWFVGTQISQSMEDGFTTSSMEAMVDYYYNLGALINLYSHSSSDGSGPAGALASQYVQYSLAKPRVWSTNTAGIYKWWLQRTNASMVPGLVNGTNGTSLTLTISGSVSADTAVEVVLPSTAWYDLQVFTNGTAATGGAWRTNGQSLKILVGISVTNAQVLYSLPPKAQNDFYLGTEGESLAVPPSGVLGNDMPGTGGPELSAQLLSGPSDGLLDLSGDGSFNYTPSSNFSGVDSFTYEAEDLLTNSSPATATVMNVAPGQLFFDTLARPSNTGLLTPWSQQLGYWTILDDQLSGTADLNTYGFAYYNDPSWTDYTVQATIQFSSTNGYGAGVGGRLNPLIGSHYAAWIYPDGSPGGPNMLKLIKFEGWTLWSLIPMVEVSIPSVGTVPHTLRITFHGANITVSVDGNTLINMPDANYDGVPPFASGGISAGLYNGDPDYSLEVSDVSVLPLTRPQIQGVTITNGAAVVNWNSIAGQIYQLQYESDPTSRNWTGLLPAVTASGINCSATDPAIGSGQRYYRVMLVP